MRADTSSIDDLFGGEGRLEAPLFQRRYVWSEEAHLGPFWTDLRHRAVLRLGDGPAAFPHFLGAILLQSDERDDRVSRIIDGQQRLLTMYMAVAAIAAVAATHDLDKLAAAARRRLRDQTGANKLRPTAPDREHIEDIVGRGDLGYLARRWSTRFAAGRARLLKSAGQTDCLAAYVGLYERVKAFAAGDGAHPLVEPDLAAASPAARLEALFDALLDDFHVVRIDLAARDDGPAIFEALNDRGAPLSAADLVRNDVVRRARAADEDAAALIADHWRPLAQDAFWRADVKVGRAKAPQLDNLLRCYLAAAGAPAASPKRVFHAYRAYVSRRPPPFADIKDELGALGRGADAFRRLIAPDEAAFADDHLAEVGRRIAPWAPSAMLPPILTIALLDGHAATDKAAAYAVIVGYLMRRDVCRLNRRNLHRAGAALARAILKDAPRRGVAAAAAEGLAMHAGLDALWPTDMRFGRSWIEEPIWRAGGPHKARRVLAELEADASGRRVRDILAERPEVDHVMPRGWGDAPEGAWPAPKSGGDMDLDDAFRRRERAVGAIGNLALIEPRLNARLGAVGFQDRRAAYAKSRYVTTRRLAAFETWDEAAIEERGHRFLPTAARLWPGPETASSLLVTATRRAGRA